MNVLVINCGSSSLKFQLINAESEEVLAKGICERIGIDGRLDVSAGRRRKRSIGKRRCRPIQRQFSMCLKRLQIREDGCC